MYLRTMCSIVSASVAPDAISSQRYVVTPDQYLRQWRQAGRADAMLARKHPDLAAALLDEHAGRTPAQFILADVVSPRVSTHHDPDKLARVIMKRIWR